MSTTRLTFTPPSPIDTPRPTNTPQPTPTQLPAPTAQRISFARGGISATVQGTTRAADADRWVLAAMGEQTMNVNLTVLSGGLAALAISGADGTVLISDNPNAVQWSGLLPKTQDYFINVKPEAGAVSYTLQVTIPPRPTLTQTPSRPPTLATIPTYSPTPAGMGRT